MQKFVTLGVVSALVTGTILGPATLHAAPKVVKKATTKKPAQPGTLGTKQMAGGEARFGQTYTYATEAPWNLTIKSVDYEVGRFNLWASNHGAPMADQKIMAIHYRIKNPSPHDQYFTGNALFQTVDGNNTTQDIPRETRRESEKDGFGQQIKPGQGVDDLVCYTIVPANQPVQKLILIFGRVGTHDKVTRFALGTAPNIIKPIPAPYADPSDKTGATPLAVVPATIGTTYTGGFFDMSLDAVAYAPGPFAGRAAQDGKQFVVATVTVTNKTWEHLYFNNTLAAVLKTDDDEKTTDYRTLLGKRDATFDGEMFDPDDPHTLRLVFEIPKDAKVKSLSLAEVLDNTNHMAHAFLYDLSDVK